MIGVLLVAGALLAWPDGAALSRLRDTTGGGSHEAGPVQGLRRRLGQLPVEVAAPVVAGGAGLVLAGPLHACAAALLAATAVDLRRRAARRRETLARLGAWDRALDDASSALRAGAGPDLALERAAAASSGATGRSGPTDLVSTLRSASAHARLGGDVSAALRASGDPVAVALAGAWLLATRHGVVLAEVVDGLRADVAARRERAVRVDATLAGPRATAVILTALPGLGVLLGSGFGADPLAVLLGGSLGGVLCLVGAGFLTAGLAWTERIVDGASR